MTTSKGFGVFKLYPLIPIIIIAAFAVLAITFRPSYNERYKIFRSNARTFALTIGRSDLYMGTERVSLLELIDSGHLTHIKNPFIGDRHCNMADSFVQMKDSRIHVTLRCGNYIIYNQDVSDISYYIYRIVTDWQEQRPRGNRDYIDQLMMFNYQIGNEYAYERFYSEEVFLYKFNRRNNTEYESINDIPNEFNIIERRFFRLRRPVGQITA